MPGFPLCCHNHVLEQVTGGRNGYGAKLCNIFSTRFEVETSDGKRQRRFHQMFTNNMSEKTNPKTTACKPSDNWTCITFQPDLAKFDMQELEDDVVALMRKRVYDVAGVLGKGCKVRVHDKAYSCTPYVKHLNSSVDRSELLLASPCGLYSALK
jgi:DNA topoisomerase-2